MKNLVPSSCVLCLVLTFTLLHNTGCVRVYVPLGVTHQSPTSDQVQTSDATALSQRLTSDTTLVIDARSQAEFAEKHYPGAINIPYDNPAIETTALGSNLERPVVVYCRSGKRAEQLRTRLISLGYTNILNGGGLEELINLK